MRKFRNFWTTTVAATLVTGAVAIGVPATTYAASTEYTVPNMNMLSLVKPAYSGASGQLAFTDQANGLWRWSPTSGAAPLKLADPPAGNTTPGMTVTAISVDGNSVLANATLYRIVDSTVTSMPIDATKFDCGTGSGATSVAWGYSPSLTRLAKACGNGTTVIGTLSGSTVTMQTFTDTTVAGTPFVDEVAVNDDGTFKVMRGRKIAGGDAEVPGVMYSLYNANGDTASTQTPPDTGASFSYFARPPEPASYAPGVSAVAGKDKGVLGMVVDGTYKPFALSSIPAPADAAEWNKTFDYLGGLLANGYGSGCSYTGSKILCFVGDLVKGQGAWIPAIAVTSGDTGRSSADGQWFVRRTAPNKIVLDDAKPTVDPTGPKVNPNDRVCFGVTGDPGDWAVVNLTPANATAAGDLRLVSSDSTGVQSFSNVNFVPGTPNPNVAIAKIGTDGKVCAVNSEHASLNLIADQLGNIRAGSFTPAQANGVPERKLDTRSTAPVQPGKAACFAVAGKVGDFAVVNITPVRAQGAGDMKMVSSDDVSRNDTFSNVNFKVGSADPNLAIAKIGADGKVCVVDSKQSAVDVIGDHLGTIAAAGFAPAQSNGVPVRKLDTRDGTALAPNASSCVATEGGVGAFAIVNLTPVSATGSGNLKAISSDLASNAPEFSNANYAVGTTDPNVAVAKIGSTGICAINGPTATTGLVIDHLGSLTSTAFAPAQSDGAPKRVLNTRA